MPLSEDLFPLWREVGGGVFVGGGEGEGEGGREKSFFAANERAEETPTNYDVGPSVGNP
jgi:hypothetical protein